MSSMVDHEYKVPDVNSLYDRVKTNKYHVSLVVFEFKRGRDNKMVERVKK